MLNTWEIKQITYKYIWFELLSTSKNLENKEDQNKSIPVEIKNISGRVVDLLTYKNTYVLIIKLHVFLGKHNSKFVCRRCLSAFSSQNVSMRHNQQCGQQERTGIKTSNESYLY